MNSARRTTLAAASAAVVLSTAGGLLTVAAAPAAAAVSCASPVFKRQFFANTTFAGTAKKTDCDSVIDQNWGTGAPAAGLPANNFGVRWSVTRDFGSGGPFAFTAAAQDGIRVYLDGTRKLDVWKNVSSTRKKTANVTIPKGKHTLRIDFVNWTGSANVKFTYAPRTTASVDKVEPLTPAAPAVTYDKATGKTKITWSRNQEMDLAGYRVHRRLKGTSYAAKPLATTTSTSYTDSTLPKTGETYYYEVRAYDKAGNESAGTTDKGVTTVDSTPPAAPFVELDACPAGRPYAAPELVTTAANAADIALYELQRQNAATGAWTTVATAAEGAFCDTGTPADGRQVTYRGRARDAAGNWSAYSAATTVTTADLTPPAAVTGARVEYRSGVPHLTWTPADDATAYQVLQYDPATGGWLDALPGTGGTTTGTDVVPRQLTAVSDTYRYAVRAVDAKGNAAAPVEIPLDLAARPEAIPAFRTTATPHGEGVMVEWSATDPWAFDGDGPLLTFHLVRTDPATGLSTTVDLCKPNSSVDLPPAAPETYSTWTGSDAPDYAGRKQVNGVCWDVSGASETTYEYRVVTEGPDGHDSAPGPAATATTPDTERPAPVRDLTAEAVPLGVHLTWTPPADDDVRKYLVWQGVTDPDTGETVWTENCWTGSSLAATEIYCPTVPDGAEHVYRVAASDGSGLIDPYAGPAAYRTADITVTLPDTRPPGWTGTEVREGQYPKLYVDCSATAGLGDCARFAGYRVERWDPATATWTTLTQGVADDAVYYVDEAVSADRLGLYYYRVVRTDASGADVHTDYQAYGIWDAWL
ncbi:PA14 domain-containing protein [Streptomyces sp. NPDC023723]|uniref:PA14 domain-containing protein n=1 Tax=Streptomyces sp. NPDC023723 TaxID=3154323 RepID=UPI00340B54B2